MHNPPHPSEVLREYFGDITLAEAAVKIGVDPMILSKVLAGESGISPAMACLLSEVFGTSPELWTGMQAQYDKKLPALRRQPNPKKRRSRRLRKKLRLAEFQQLGFEYSVIWHKLPDATSQETFIDQFLESVIERRGLLLGGGCTDGAIVGRGQQNPTELDQAAVRAWMSAWPGVAKVHIGPLVDEWYEVPFDRESTRSPFTG